MFIACFRRCAPALPAVGLVCVFLLASATVSAERFTVQVAPSLASWIDQTVSQHADVRAAQAAVQAAQSRLEGQGLPIYNPELGLEYQRTDINLVTAGISQTLDWHDKQGARLASQQQQVALAKAEWQQVREKLAGELLGVMAQIAANQADQALVDRQLALLQRFERIAQQRARAGDLAQIELELSQLAVVEGQLLAARSAAAMAGSRQQLLQFAVQQPKGAGLPQLPPLTVADAAQVDGLLRQHPVWRVAMARSQNAQLAIRLADTERQADPTIGLRGGREGQQTLIGLQLSMPLQVRNRFESDVAAARSEADQSSELAMAQTQRLRAQMQSARARFAHLADAWQLWERQGSKSLSNRVRLLEKLWRAGELSTADYLVQLKQSMETEQAGMDLRRDLWAAWVEWLTASGQVSVWLGLDSTGVAQ